LVGTISRNEKKVLEDIELEDIELEGIVGADCFFRIEIESRNGIQSQDFLVTNVNRNIEYATRIIQNLIDIKQSENKKSSQMATVIARYKNISPNFPSGHLCSSETAVYLK